MGGLSGYLFARTLSYRGKPKKPSSSRGDSQYGEPIACTREDVCARARILWHNLPITEPLHQTEQHH